MKMMINLKILSTIPINKIIINNEILIIEKVIFLKKKKKNIKI